MVRECTRDFLDRLPQLPATQLVIAPMFAKTKMRRANSGKQLPQNLGPETAPDERKARRGNGPGSPRLEPASTLCAPAYTPAKDVANALHPAEPNYKHA